MLSSKKVYDVVLYIKSSGESKKSSFNKYHVSDKIQKICFYFDKMSKYTNTKKKK